MVVPQNSSEITNQWRGNALEVIRSRLAPSRHLRSTERRDFAQKSKAQVLSMETVPIHADRSLLRVPGDRRSDQRLKEGRPPP
ncbi:hypothetical protein JCGZ_06680 [Jatropha curcas]|uniref:Uncharacterized protein n=1 Tax=Jatropha curcas TaxID=180498 RepID=A0A067LNW8_JATCU|nr:hypothetical protein JCGZ_06680 [Jatropha curcas]